jgi:hypothetical protein
MEDSVVAGIFKKLLILLICLSGCIASNPVIKISDKKSNTYVSNTILQQTDSENLHR